ncbi:MAG: site-specific integrase, partial [Gemmatimonadota bacterium]
MSTSSSLPSPITEFLRELESGRQLSAHTVAAYRRDLTEFTNFLATWFQQDEWDWRRVDRNALRRFLGHLSQQKLARRTIARRLSAVRTFFRFLHREDLIEANPARTVRSPRLEKTLPQWLTRGAAEHVFNTAENRAAEGGFRALRDLAILETFYASGMRLSELQGLDMDDLDLITDQVKVRGKGRKERIVPLGTAAVKALRNYELRRTEVAPLGPLRDRRAVFISERG